MISPTYEHGYWHGRNGYDKAATGYEYETGYRDGAAAARQAPPPPHSENDNLSEGDDA